MKVAIKTIMAVVCLVALLGGASVSTAATSELETLRVMAEANAKSYDVGLQDIMLITEEGDIAQMLAATIQEALGGLESKGDQSKKGKNHWTRVEWFTGIEQAVNRLNDRGDWMNHDAVKVVYQTMEELTMLNKESEVQLVVDVYKFAKARKANESGTAKAALMDAFQIEYAYGSRLDMIKSMEGDKKSIIERAKDLGAFWAPICHLCGVDNGKIVQAIRLLSEREEDLLKIENNATRMRIWEIVTLKQINKFKVRNANITDIAYWKGDIAVKIEVPPQGVQEAEKKSVAPQAPEEDQSVVAPESEEAQERESDQVLPLQLKKIEPEENATPTLNKRMEEVEKKSSGAKGYQGRREEGAAPRVALGKSPKIARGGR